MIFLDHRSFSGLNFGRGKCEVNQVCSKGVQHMITPCPLLVQSWMERNVSSASKVGTGFWVKKIWMAFMSTKLSIFGKSTMP